MEQIINKTILDNGIRILTKKIPHVHSVSMGVWVNVGARDEKVDENGLSHCIEHMIFKGTKKRSAFQIAKQFDAIGGQTNAFTSMEMTCYHAKVMDTHMETMVDILSDIFLNSKFSSSEVEKEIPVILQEIGMAEDNPEEYIHTLLGDNLWGGNPLGRSILGSRESINSFSAETIKDFFLRFYQPDRIVISAAGNLDHEHFIDLIGPTFEMVQSGEKLPRRVAPVMKSPVELHYRELEQVHICLGAKGISITDPDRYAFSLMNTILGGNMSSRVFQEIRERRGLAYSVYSFISSYVDTGMFGIYVGVSPKSALESIELILKELRRLKEEKVDHAELHDAMEYTKGNILISAENTDNQMVRLAQNEIHFGRYVPLQEIVSNVESVVEDDILHLAQRLLEPETFALTILGPVSEEKSFEKIMQ